MVTLFNEVIKLEIEVENREKAADLLNRLESNGIRITKSSIRKSLPHYKHHLNTKISLFLTLNSFADQIQIKQAGFNLTKVADADRKVWELKE